MTESKTLRIRLSGGAAEALLSDPQALKKLEETIRAMSVPPIDQSIEFYVPDDKEVAETKDVRSKRGGTDGG